MGATNLEEEASEFTSCTTKEQSETMASCAPSGTSVEAMAMATLSAAAAEDCIDGGTSPVTERYVAPTRCSESCTIANAAVGNDFPVSKAEPSVKTGPFDGESIKAAVVLPV